jgi:uncharacterized membrane protein
MTPSRPSPTTAILGVVFVGAGTMHFVRPDFFESIVPDWFPDKRAANIVSGAAEIVLGLAVFPRATRRPALLGLSALTLAVFPANVDMAINDVEVTPADGRLRRSTGTATGAARALNWGRLPLQAPLLWLLRREARRA